MNCVVSGLCPSRTVRIQEVRNYNNQPGVHKYCKQRSLYNQKQYNHVVPERV